MPDYGLLGGIGEGLSKFADSYMRAKQFKNEQNVQQAGLLSQGLEQKDDGSYGLTSLAKQKQDAESNQYANILKNNNPDPNHPDSEAARNVTRGMIDSIAGKGQGQKIIPDSMSAADIHSAYGGLIDKYLAAKSSEVGAQTKATAFAGPKEETIEFTKHKSAVNSVQDDAPTKNLLNGYQSIQNALVEFKNNPSVQSFHTLQSALRQNAGSANKSGVAERAQQYSDSTGMRFDEVKQFLSGDPDMANVNLSDPKLVQAYMNVAKGELDQKRIQAHQQIDKKAGAFTSIYKKPSMKDYQQDFKNTVDAQKSQFAPTDDLIGGQQSGGTKQPPGGHMSVKQNGHVFNWNPTTGTYE